MTVTQNAISVPVDGADFLDIAGIANFFSSIGIETSVRQAYRIAEEDGFPAIRVRNKIHSRKDWIIAWLESRRPQTAPSSATRRAGGRR